MTPQIRDVECEKAWSEGVNAYHNNANWNNEPMRNPYNEETQQKLYDAWDDGFSFESNSFDMYWS